MKLIELLHTYKGNLKVGAKSGFFWCGVPNENTMDQLDCFSMIFKKKFKREIKDLKDFLNPECFKKFWKRELILRVDLFLNENPEATKEDLEEMRAEWQKDKDKSFEQSSKKLQVLENHINNWSNLEYREIKELYDSIDDKEPEGTKIAIIEGIEIGDFWTTKEYKEKYDE